MISGPFERQSDLLDWRHLQKGNLRQRRAYCTIIKLDLEKLYSIERPMALSGTIPIGIDVRRSDLDVLFHAVDLDRLEAEWRSRFAGQQRSRLLRGS